MGKTKHSMRFNEKFLKRNFNESLSKVTNSLGVKERDYMIRTAMARLNISSEWHDAVAKGANYLDGVRFWELVDMARSKKSPARWFVACCCRECQ